MWVQQYHRRQFKNYSGTGNPWKISYGMNQHNSVNFPTTGGQLPSAKTAKLASVRQPANMFLAACRLLTDSALRSKIDSLWDKLWSGGHSNPLDAIEQLSFLLFL